MSFIQVVFQLIYQISFTMNKCLRYFSIRVLENTIKYVHFLVNWTNVRPLCTGKWALTDDPILIYSLHKQGQYNKASSVPISYKQKAFVNSMPRQNVLTSHPAPMFLYVPWNGTGIVPFQILWPCLNLKILPYFIGHAIKLLSSEHIQLHSFKIPIFSNYIYPPVFKHVFD